MSNQKLQGADLFLVNRAALSYTSIYSDVKDNVLDSHLIQSDTEPDLTTYPDLVPGTIWVNTNEVPPTLLVWDGSQWSQIEGGGGIVDPDPTDVIITPPAQGGTGTQGDPYILAPVTSFTAGGTVYTVETITIQNQPTLTGFSADVIEGGARFDQPVLVTDTQGEWTGRFEYQDVPTSTAGDVYEGTLKIGGSSVYFKWEVTQIANQTPIVGSDGTTTAPNASPGGVEIGGFEKLYGEGTGTWADGAGTLRAVATSGPNTYNNAIKFSVDGGAMDQNDKAIVDGQTIAVQFVESMVNAANENDVISGAITNDIGFYQEWQMTKKTSAFSFTIAPLVDQPLNDVVTTGNNPIQGVNAPSELTIDGAQTLTSVEVSVDGGAWTSTYPVTFNPGDSLQARGTTGGDVDTEYTVTFDIGGTQSTWSVATTAAEPTIQQPQITSPANGSLEIETDMTLVSDAYTDNGTGAGNHTESDWQVYEADLATLISAKITEVEGGGIDVCETDAIQSVVGAFDGRTWTGNPTDPDNFFDGNPDTRTAANAGASATATFAAPIKISSIYLLGRSPLNNHTISVNTDVGNVPLTYTGDWGDTSISPQYPGQWFADGFTEINSITFSDSGNLNWTIAGFQENDPVNGTNLLKDGDRVLTFPSNNGFDCFAAGDVVQSDAIVGDFISKLSVSTGTLSEASKNNAFDGDISTECTGPNTGSMLTLDLSSSPISYKSSVEIHTASPYDEGRINDNAFVNMPQNAWTTLASGSGIISRIQVNDDTAKPVWTAIKVDGKYLIDSSLFTGNDVKIISKDEDAGTITVDGGDWFGSDTHEVSQVWDKYLTCPDGFTAPAADAFKGDKTAEVGAIGSQVVDADANGYGKIIFEPETPITGAIKFYHQKAREDKQYSVNGGNAITLTGTRDNNAPSSNEEVDLGSITLNKLELWVRTDYSWVNSTNAQAAVLIAIELDGKVLAVPGRLIKETPYSDKLTVATDKSLEKLKGGVLMTDGDPAGGPYTLTGYNLVTTDIESVATTAWKIDSGKSNLVLSNNDRTYTSANGWRSALGADIISKTDETYIEFQLRDDANDNGDHRFAIILDDGSYSPGDQPTDNKSFISIGYGSIAGDVTSSNLTGRVLINDGDSIRTQLNVFGDAFGGTANPNDLIALKVIPSEGKVIAYRNGVEQGDLVDAAVATTGVDRNKFDFTSGDWKIYAAKFTNQGFVDLGEEVKLTFPGDVSTNPDLRYFKPGDVVQSGVYSNFFVETTPDTPEGAFNGDITTTAVTNAASLANDYVKWRSPDLMNGTVAIYTRSNTINAHTIVVQLLADDNTTVIDTKTLTDIGNASLTKCEFTGVSNARYIRVEMTSGGEPDSPAYIFGVELNGTLLVDGEETKVISTGYPDSNTMTVDGGDWDPTGVNGDDHVEYQTNGGTGVLVSVNTDDNTLLIDSTGDRDNRFIATNSEGTDFFISDNRGGDVPPAPATEPPNSDYTLVEESLADTTNLTSYDVTGLNNSKAHFSRVKYRDDTAPDAIESEWSPWHVTTTEDP